MWRARKPGLSFKSPLSVIFLGDSFSTAQRHPDVGDPAHFADWFARADRNAKVLSAGVGGNTLTQIYARLPRWLAYGPNVIGWNGGINGTELTGGLVSAASDPNTLMRSLTTAGLTDIKRAGIMPIAINVGPWKAHVSWSANRQTWTDSYNAWLLAYCAANGIAHYDLYTALEDPGTPDTLLAAWDSTDGLHANETGWAVPGFDLSRLIHSKYQWQISRRMYA